MKKVKKIELTYIKKEKLNKDTFTYYFSRKDLDFDFKPGQYIKIFLKVENPDNRGTSRYFTISSSPTDKDFLTITTRIIKSSFKLKLNNLITGEKINAFGPLGYFDIDLKEKREQVFLTGGIGLTPAYSIISFINSRKEKTKIVLIASFQKMPDIIFYNELKEFESKNKNIKIIYTLTKDDNRIKEIEEGHIDQNLIKKYSSDFKKSKYFIIGSEAFELKMFELLTKMGIQEKNIFKENFPGY